MVSDEGPEPREEQEWSLNPPSKDSVDNPSAGYLLELAAKEAERQLREQVLAAFPNSEFHEHVDHFVDCDREDFSSSIDEVQRSRESPVNETREPRARRRFRKQQVSNGKQLQELIVGKEKDGTKDPMPLIEKLPPLTQEE